MEILLWPNPKLKQVCEPVTDFESAEAFLAIMTSVARAAGGIGLAANQLGRCERMLVAYDARTKDWRSFVNPKLIKSIGTPKRMTEGCLSIPGYFDTVGRYPEVVVEYMSVARGFGAWSVGQFDGQLAHILQHEIEHLDGKMFVDKVPGGRDRARAALKKARR